MQGELKQTIGLNTRFENMNNKSVLITGGSGLVGTVITDLLLAKGYTVKWLTRSLEHIAPPEVKLYEWLPDRMEMDAEALKDTDVIIHLAGTNIGQRWTSSRKQSILESRVQGTETLNKYLKSTPNKVSLYLGASAIGFYGSRNGGSLLEETTKGGTGFQAEVTQRWEKAHHELLQNHNLNHNLFRIGVVLSMKSGALPKMVDPIKSGIGWLGDGTQTISWIHIKDLAQLFVNAVENPLPDGTYNAVADEVISNKDLTIAIADQLKKSLWLKSVPSFLIKLSFGEMAELVLGSISVSNKKLKQAGFQFQYPTVSAALKDLL